MSMAKLPRIPGLKVSIAVDGTSLPEHTDSHTNNDTRRKVTRYVQSQPDKAFCIRLRCDQSCETLTEHDIGATIRIDGRNVSHKIFRFRNLRHDTVLKIVSGPRYQKGST
jgi:hypothetical protein